MLTLKSAPFWHKNNSQPDLLLRAQLVPGAGVRSKCWIWHSRSDLINQPDVATGSPTSWMFPLKQSCLCYFKIIVSFAV